MSILTLPLMMRRREFIFFLFVGFASCQNLMSPPICEHATDIKPFFEVTSNNKTDLSRQMNKASLEVIPHQLEHFPGHLTLAAQITNCWDCCILNLTSIHLELNCTLLVDTQFAVDLYILNQTNITDVQTVWRSTESFNEEGSYCLLISPDGSSTGSWDRLEVTLYTADDGIITALPVYITLAILVFLSLLWILLRYMHSKDCFVGLMLLFRRRDGIQADFGSPTDVVIDNVMKSSPARKRLRSLDTFRGLALMLMIFVNYGGGGYWFFNHSYWNGITVADLLFPWFVWIMGTSLVLAMNNQLLKGIPRTEILLKVIKRTLILFCLGLMIGSLTSSGKVDLENLRIPGVLQRLALTYFIIAIIQVIFARTGDPHSDKWWSSIRDIVPFWAEWLICMALLSVHLLITFLLPVDGCPLGYLGPGGFHDEEKYFNCTGGAARVVDLFVFGEKHIYQDPTSKPVYQNTIGYDPEGLLGTLTSAVMCYIGLHAGRILLIYPTDSSRIKRWIIWSLIWGAAAALLSQCSQNEGWIPLNKNLWSISFIFALSSMAYLLLCVCYILIDVTNWWSGFPFYYPGMNSITIYICHEVFHNYFPVSWQVPHTHATELAMDIWGTSVWIIVSVIMYKKKIFIAI